jgi:hypothetical protein
MWPPFCSALAGSTVPRLWAGATDCRGRRGCERPASGQRRRWVPAQGVHSWRARWTEFPPQGQRRRSASVPSASADSWLAACERVEGGRNPPRGKEFLQIKHAVYTEAQIFSYQWKMWQNFLLLTYGRHLKSLRAPRKKIQNVVFVECYQMSVIITRD